MEQDNKYIFDIDSFEAKSNVDAKELRRRKHKKSRVFSWVFFVLFICIIALGVFFGISRFLKPQGEKTASISEQVESIENVDSVIENLTDDEEEIIVTPPKEVDTEPTEEELFLEAVRAYVEAIPLEDKVAGIFLTTPEALTDVGTVVQAGEGTKTALSEYAIGGLIYSAKNMTSKEAFIKMLSNTKEYSRYPLFLAVNEELGNTTFSNVMNVTGTMTAKKVGDTADSSIAYLEEEKIAKYMSECGLNLNLGLVCEPYIESIADDDTDTSGSTKTNDDSRYFSADASLNDSLTEKTIAALHEYDVDACVKFFPGESSGSGDTENGLSTTERTKEEMLANELSSFKNAVLNGADMVIVSHESVPSLTGDNTQCSLSKAVMTDLLRIELELDSVIVMTDSLSKSAISSYYESGEASVIALKAGADMIMCPEDFKTAYSAVLEAVNKGIISKDRITDSLVRIYSVKFKGLTTDEVNAYTEQLTLEARSVSGNE